MLALAGPARAQSFLGIVDVQSQAPLSIVLTWSPVPDPFLASGENLSLELSVREPDGSFVGRYPCSASPPSPTSPSGGTFSSPDVGGYSRSPEEYAHPNPAVGRFPVLVTPCAVYFTKNLSFLPDLNARIDVFSAGQQIATFNSLSVPRPYDSYYYFYVDANPSAEPPQVSVTPPDVDFGFVAPNASRSRRVLIQNTGTPTSSLNGSMQSPALPFSIVSGGGPFSLPGGQSRIVNVDFAPTQPGRFSDQINILSNDPSRSTTTVGLEGHSACDANVDVTGFLNPRQQPTISSCWATAASVLASWLRNGPLTELQVAAQADAVMPTVTVYVGRLQRPPDDQGLVLSELQSFLNRLGLRRSLLTARPTVCDVAELLRHAGPLWVTTGNDSGVRPSAHAQVVIGIHGDGTEPGTTVSLIDPDDGLVHQVPYISLMVTIAAVNYWPQWLHF